MIIDSNLYRKAFQDYLRWGTPIHRSLKNTPQTPRYIWRTRRDGLVRSSHRRNDGRVFSWDDPPETGHPGDDFNCRCEAIPYVRGETEFAYFMPTTSLTPGADGWSTTDMVRYYYSGNGRAVTLSEIGHLAEVVEQYAFNDGNEGAYRRLADQIADEGRRTGPGSIYYRFEGAYDFGRVEFAHGNGTVSGAFSGTAAKFEKMLVISGETMFLFADEFADPLDIGIETGGNPYDITGTWTARFVAEVLADPASSIYFDRQ